MVEFLSVLIGLYTGIHPVELAVTGQVAAIELRLDGTTLAVLGEPPWIIDCDFGPLPTPHEIVAVALDAEGAEIDRATKWVNLADATSAAALSFEHDERGLPRAARITWESIGTRRPRSAEVLFDGRPLEVSDLGHIPLPRYEPDRIHFVSATVRFDNEQVSRLEASFGGQLGEEVRTELTAVAVTLEKGARLPDRARLEGWFIQGGRPLAVHGVETGPAEVILVRDPTVQPYLERLAELALDTGEVPTAGRPESSGVGARRQRHQGRPGRDPLDDLRYQLWLGDEAHLRFLAPGAAPLFRDAVSSEMFRHSAAYGPADGGLMRIGQRLTGLSFPVRLADAVATAGMAAHGTHRRRAVVLLLGETTRDDSSHSAAAARAYLRQLHVPLTVWAFAGETPPAGWTGARQVGPAAQARRVPGRFKDAVVELREALAGQRIVWLEGRHLPQTIELSPAARGIRLAGH